MQMTLDTADIVDIQRVIALYGHVIDEDELDRLAEIFSADAVFDLTDFGRGVAFGLAAIEETMRASLHPVAHHATNVVVSADAGNGVRVMSKGIGVGAGGRVGSVTYRDRFTATPNGWRIMERVALLRRPRPVP